VRGLSIDTAEFGTLYHNRYTHTHRHTDTTSSE
jgi:hypothetical protein